MIGRSNDGNGTNKQLHDVGSGGWTSHVLFRLKTRTKTEIGPFENHYYIRFRVKLINGKIK